MHAHREMTGLAIIPAIMTGLAIIPAILTGLAVIPAILTGHHTSWEANEDLNA